MPYVVPVSGAARAFGEDGSVQNENVRMQLTTLGSEVARVAERFADDAKLHRHLECAEAADRVAAATAS